MLRSPVGWLVAICGLFSWANCLDADDANKPEPGSIEHKPMLEAVASFGAAVQGDYLYVFSGHAGTTHKYGRDKLSDHFRRIRFDDPKAEWEELPTQEPAQSAALVSDGKSVYRIGGLTFDSTTDEPTVYRSTSHFARFDPESKQWTKLADLPQPRSSHDAAVLGRSIYVVGGWSLQGKETGDAPWYKDMLRFDLDRPESGWQSLPGPGYETRGLSVAAHAGKLVVLGGMNDEILRDVSVYDPASLAWSKGPEMIGDSDAAGFGSSAFAVGGKLYYSGDSGDIYRLSSDGKTWEKSVKLKTPRMFLRLLAVGNDRLLAVGGTQNSRTRTATVESIRVQ